MMAGLGGKATYGEYYFFEGCTQIQIDRPDFVIAYPSFPPAFSISHCCPNLPLLPNSVVMTAAT